MTGVEKAIYFKEEKKMKRILGIILAIAMLVSMIPSAFAEETTEGGTVVYSPEYVFNLKAIGHTTDTIAKSVSVLGPTSGSNGYTLDRSESSGEWWYTNTFNIPTCNVQAEDLCFYTPVSPVKGSSYEDNNGVVLNLIVDKSGTYVPEILDAGMYYTSFLDIYLIHEDDLAKRGWKTDDVSVVPTLRKEGSMTDPSAEIKHILARDMNSNVSDGVDETAPLVNLIAGKYYLYAVISDSSVIDDYCTTKQRSYGSIKSIKLTSKGTVTAAVDDTELKPGNTATISATATDGDGNAISDATIAYSSSDSDVITVDSATGAISAVGEGEAYAVATTTVDGVSVCDKVAISVTVNRNPKYVFKTTAFINSIGSDLWAATDPDNINEEVSAIWSIVSHPNMVNKQISSSTSLFCTEGGATSYLGNNALVLKIETDIEGVYTPTIEYAETAQSGLLDFYTIPVSEASNLDMTNLTDIQKAIAKADHMASIDQHTDAVTAPPYVGNSVYLPAGENYVIMVISKGCGDSTHTGGRHYGYIQTLSLAHTAGVSITTTTETLAVDKTATLSAKVLDNDGNPVDATVTYESSNEAVATVNGNVITAVEFGTARITATAVTANGTYTDYVDITVPAIWDPVYAFHYNALSDTSLISSSGSSTSAPVAGVTEESQLDANVSTGMWTFAANINFQAASLYGSYSQLRADYSAAGENNALVLNARIERPGTYTAKIMYGVNPANGLSNIYLVPKAYAENKKWDMTTSAGVNAAKADSANAASEVALLASVDMNTNSEDSKAAVSGIVNYTGNTVNVTEKEFYIVINTVKGCTETSNGDYFCMIGKLTLERTGSVFATSADTTLEIGETTTVSANTFDNRDNAVSAEVTYENLTPAVATLEGNTVTALTEGNAVIKATAAVDGVTVTDTVTIEVTPKQIAVGTNINGKLYIDTYDIGKEAKVTAPEITGKTFRHWVLGTETNGIPVSTNASYTFKAVTNTYLTAVYSDEVAEDAKVVEFYLENGGYVGSAVANESGTVTLPDEPTLTGYEFISWMTDAETIFDANTVVTDAITKVVGTFNAATISEGVSYGDPIKNEAATEKLWKRDGKTVAYGTSYTYYVWGASTIEAVDGEKPAIPIIVLDEEVKADNARMIEYDAAGFTIIEAGIIFGNGTNMTVDSCMYKAKSKLNKTHGQFTAKPPVEEGYTTAIG